MFREGQQIGNYTLINPLGRGGFGEVWLAERRTQLVTTKVALKLPHDSQIDLETVRQEAILWEKASGHPNVLPIIEADIIDGQIIIVSEFAPDGTLADLLKNAGKIPPQKAVEIAIGISAGLEFLHSRRIIHRDIKPQNILLQGETPRLADFGISHALNTSVASRSANIKGTFSYMSPETFDGKRNEQTDIWAVGVVLYQMLKGNLPFPQTETTALFGAIIMREPEPLTEEIPPRLKEIVGKALAKLPENRYQTAREMREDLKKVLVTIAHPTFAPTEVLQISNIPEIKTETPHSPSFPPTIAPNSPIAKTQVQLTQTEQQTEQFTKPFEIKQSAPAPSIVTQIAQSQTDKQQKPLPTVAQSFAGKTKTSQKLNKLFLIIPTFFILALILGSVFLIRKRPGIFNSFLLPPIEANQLIPFRKGSKWGFCDAQKRVYITPKFDFQVKPFSDDLALVRGNGEFGFIDKTGYFVIKLDYDDQATSFSEGMAIIMRGTSGDYKFGFIDKTGKTLVQPKYKSAEPFSDGLAKVCNENTKCGFIDKSGSEVIPLTYSDAASFSEGLALVNSKIFIDKSGKTVFQTDRFDLSSFSDGFASADLTNYIDKVGNVALKTDFEDLHPFSDNLAGFREKNGYKSGFIDKTGEIVIQPQFQAVGNFSEGLAAVIIDKKCGFIDKTGKIVIAPKYNFQLLEMPKFKNGIAKVGFNNNEFYIGKDGTEYFEN